jgi:hypothetical protein
MDQNRANKGLVEVLSEIANLKTSDKDPTAQAESANRR